MTTISVDEKPTICPQCNSQKIAEIVYGLPDNSKELKRKLKAEEIVLGGCCVTENDPTWKCIDCDTLYNKK